MKTVIFYSAMLVCALGLNANSALADLLIRMDNVYNGSVPGGSSPWGTAKFEDVMPGEVKLTMTNLLEFSSEYVATWYFNLDPALRPRNLVFTYLSGQVAKKVTKGANRTEPPGQGGDFDFSFGFGRANNANRFLMGETSVYKITGPGITSSSFNWFSENENNSFVSVMAVRGILNPLSSRTLSGEIAGTVAPVSQAAVPELSSVVAWGGIAGLVGLVSLLRNGRRRCHA